MSLKQILQSLKAGEISLDEARRAVAAASSAPAGGNGHPNGTAPSAVAAASDASADGLQQNLRESLAAALYMEIEDVQLDVPFTELGLDSIVGVEWLRVVNQEHGVKIPATRMYDFPTLIEFSSFLSGELAAKQPAQVEKPVRAANSAEAKVVLAPVGNDTPARPARDVVTPAKASSPAGGIAVVGMSGRYPGSANLRRFWENLREGRNLVSEIPADRWDVRPYYDPDPTKPGKTCCKWLGSLEDIACFDSSFFMIPPAEAEVMDPQHRIFLEESWKAFEDAGYSPQTLSGRKCGVYMGIMNSEYAHMMPKESSQGLDTGNSSSIAVARISYHLNLRGPAVAIDTACSSSLVAVHLACQALRNGETDMALAGGVTLYLTPASMVGMSAAGMLSPDGQCKSFDDSANGFVPGEGAGAVILKRLEDAERDGDCIHGVLIASGINQDGRTNGITAPSVQSQIELERDVYDRFDIDLDTISCVEAHGTGTRLGDPIELTALNTVFRERTSRRNFCALGSVKSNIGHTSAAAGMAGVHKMLLSMQHRQLVPSLHFNRPNVHCDFEDSPFYVNTTLRNWEAQDGVPRRVAVSSFGFSGTNAHVVIEEYGDTRRVAAEAGSATPVPIVLSARDADRLQAVAQSLMGFLAEESSAPPVLSDLAYTLQVGRDPMQERLAFVASSTADVVEQLRRFCRGDLQPGIYRGRVARQRGRLAFFEADAETLSGIQAQAKAGDFSQLLELWVKGLVFDWETLPSAHAHRRVSLPTYPFARERHWAAGAAPAESTVRNVPAAASRVAASEERRVQGGMVSLASPQMLSFRSEAPSPRRLGALDSPADWRKPEAAAPGSVKTIDEGDGVVSLCIHTQDGRNRFTRELLEEISACLTAVSRRADARVVLLRGNGSVFLAGDSSAGDSIGQRELSPLMLGCELPVIAVLQGAASGSGWIAAALCDLMVCSEKSEFRLTGADIKAEDLQGAAAFLSERFGNAVAAAIDKGNSTLIGARLRELGMQAPVLPSEEVDAFALALARRVAAAPRKSLVLLKQRLAQVVAEMGQTSMDSALTEGAKGDLQQQANEDWMSLALAATAAPLEAAQSVNLSSSAVKLEVFASGVALLTMRDEESKNSFSEALSQGLAQAFRYIAETAAVKTVVLTGYGHYFATGGTREALLAIQAGKASFTDARISSLPLECDVPVIAAMQGHAIGAGWTLGMFSDGVLLSTESAYGSPYMRYGFTPGAGSTLIFPWRFGRDLGREILLIAEEYKGKELKQRGVSMPVLPREEVVERALAAAHHLAQHSRESLVRWKKERADRLRQSLEPAFASELSMHEQTFVGNSEVLARIEALYEKPGDLAAPALVQKESLSRPLPSEEGEEDSEALRSIVATLRETLAEELHLDTEKVDIEVAFVEMGLDSINTITWLRELNGRYPLQLTAAEVYNHPTVLELARHLLTAGVMDGVLQAGQKPVAEPEPSVIDTVTAAESAAVQPPPAVTIAPLPSGSRHFEARPHDIAVIGMAGRFPMARNVDALWKNLVEGRDCISEVSPERWSLDRYYDPNPQTSGKTYSKWMGALEDVDKFDPLFFNIAPLEAAAMDPQQRLFLQACWSCFEDAGYDPLKLSGTRCGVFAGCGAGDYGLIPGSGDLDSPALTGGAGSILAARISYFLNLQGPCIALDTACSASLVAIASACDSLLLGTSDLALAGGVSVMATPMMHVMTSKAGMLSRDGRCFTFDQKANGFVPGEGIGVILLKRLEDAERDGNRIDAVIRGWGVNQDGKTNGITAPSGDAQTRLQRYVYERFDIDPGTIQLVETHGTGTRLGDPIEVAALTASFRSYTSRRNYCALGAVKSNVGHLLAAAGVTGAIKSVLALKHRKLPPSVHFATPNEHIDFADSPFYVNTVCRDWEIEEGEVRRAAVSSFGFSGTNAHLVVEEYPEPLREGVEEDASSPAVILLSAKDRSRLRDQAENLFVWLRDRYPEAGCTLQDLAYTLQTGRTPMPERLAFLAESDEAARRKLQSFLTGEEPAELYRGRVHSREDAISRLASPMKAVGEWIARGEFARIAEAWSQGAEIDWGLLHAGHPRRLVSLPTYPFARERYWTAEASVAAETTPQVKPAAGVEAATSTLLCRPVWRLSTDAARQEQADPFARHIVLLCGSFASQAERIEPAMPGVRCVPLDSRGTDIADRFTDMACQAMEVLKGLIAEQPKEKVLVQTLIDSSGEEQLLAGLSGLLRTAGLENPAICGQLIAMNPSGEVAAKLLESRALGGDGSIRYVDGRRETLAFEEIADSAASSQLCWNDGGVYLITGGMGALGWLFAQRIAESCTHPTILLSGRSALHGDLPARLETLRSQGAHVLYRQADLADASSVARLMDGIHSDFGHLDGILHAAGITRDSLIPRKSAEEFREVLAAKVRGTVLLERAARPLHPKFILLFSSCAGVTGNLGQADYASANAFMDAFAQRYAASAGDGDARPRVLSMDWPYWQSGGIRLADETLAAMQQRTGAAPMETEAGMHALDQAFGSEFSQVMVLAGDVPRLKVALLDAKPAPRSEDRRETVSGVDEQQLRDHVTSRLKSLFGETIRLDEERIDEMEPIENYGIDSILITKLHQRLEVVFPGLPQTLLFEVPHLAALAEQLVDRFRADCIRWTGLDASAQVAPQTVAVAPAETGFPAIGSETPGEPSTLPAPRTEPRGVQEPIAVIGLSGRFAAAEDLQSLWEILKSGRDCITEIPGERWPLESFFCADPDEAVARGMSYGKWGGFLNSFAEFDPLFFNISPVQALGMDPQERLFLETSWEVMESAGYTRERIASATGGNVGVFVGITKTGFDKCAPAWKRKGTAVVPRTSFGSVANRLSYFLNLHGPSMPIDTMCSSSLTAIHAACQSLRQGDCRMAIAGGVNLYLHPSTFVELSAQRMLSTDGRCRSFGKGGNGLVPGEGVGAVLLKPLAQALADGDSIHAVIRGTHVNHGGKTNGYTVPNPTAQRDLIREALHKAGVDARQVSYVEAHGTGTELGDPIEAAGLTEAFRQDTAETGFCALGSIKSNLGHLEAAAGIAGFFKVILQMKHRQIAPSLHARELNPAIPFSEGPFFVPQQLEDWKRPALREGSGETARLAGISSFGAGGSNAHIIVEEPPREFAAASASSESSLQSVIVVLSAKTEDRLPEYADKLHRFLCDDSSIEQPALVDLAYTLQTAREAMEWRVGFLVGSLGELKSKLRAFADGASQPGDVIRGHVEKARNAFGRFSRDEDMHVLLDAWLQKRKLANLLEVWVSGTQLEWEKLYDRQPRRIVLPTYPFAREKFWIPLEPEVKNQAEGTPLLHPLVHENTSDLKGLRFTSKFSGEEFYLADHMVGGRKLLPGVACLEMARAAVMLASDSLQPTSGVAIRNVAWIRPIAVEDQPRTIHIGLLDEGDGVIDFEIYSSVEEGDPVLHSQGVTSIEPAAEVPMVDLDGLRAAVNSARLDATQCYAAFESMGVHYGPSHRSLAEVFAGDGQVLARLVLPDAASAEDAVLLHPSLLDGALQASIGLSLQAGESGLGNMAATVPFAMEELRFYRPCEKETWVWIRKSEATPSSGAAQKLDLDLCDAQGKVHVHIQGLTFRPLTSDSAPSSGGSVLLTSPVWEETSVSAVDSDSSFDQRYVLVCGPDSWIPEGSPEALPDCRWERLPFAEDEIPQSFAAAAVRTFALVKEALSQPSSRRTLMQIVVPSEGKGSLFRGLAGMLHTAHLESPSFIGQVIEIASQTSGEGLSRILAENAACSDVLIRYRKGIRYTQQWRELPPSLDPVSAAWRVGGVYWITGGAGGLGRIFAERIVKEARGVTVILTGRSAPDSRLQDWITSLQRDDARIEYRQADLRHLAEVERLTQTILNEHGKISGILHAAGVKRDRLISGKEPEEIYEVLAPKVAGAWHLDAATKNVDLDFFAIFAAGAGVLGNPGQADYAAANAFLDAFADYRNALRENAARKGLTLSIDWPLWKDGAMTMDAASRAAMQEKLGMISLASHAGLDAFAQAMASGRSQVMPLAGDMRRLRELLASDRKQAESVDAKAEEAPQHAGNVSGLEPLAIEYLRGVLSNALNVPEHRLRPDEPFSQFGIDSIVVMNLTHRLEETFGSLPKTLFFEHHNLQSLARYFAESHPAKLATVVHRQETDAPQSGKLEARRAAASVSNSQLRTRSIRPSTAQVPEWKDNGVDRKLDIAIIGLSGRYPMAPNTHAFWANLRDGRDCITEVPPSRWNWRDYYSGDNQEPGGHASKWGGFIDGVDQFDPQFFGISPRVAPFIDPQERLLLEETWKAIEDAGYRPKDLHAEPGSDAASGVGVYIGSMYGEYQLIGAELTMAGIPAAFAGNLASLANRISYFLNLDGPSMMVDTMCSSSLTCIHLASQDLKLGRTRMAIAGGVNLNIHPNKYRMLSVGRFLSGKGRCESFGEGGDGYIPSEGVGVVLLKRLADAERDGDHIYGVIRGSALNHGGRTNGYSVPNPNAQSRVIAQAMKEAGIRPHQVTYIEAHGTGTKLGDPIEIAGLSKAFGPVSGDAHCWVGSVKSNIGHCEAAAGVAGLTKILLQMKHGKIVPSIHSSVLNTHIDFQATSFDVNQTLRDWETPEVDGRHVLRVAGLSSFGAGGSNAHMVIEEYRSDAVKPAAAEMNSAAPSVPALIVLSAKSEDRLRKAARNLGEFLDDPEQSAGVRLVDIAYTLQACREPMEERLGFTAASIEALREQLTKFLNSASPVDGQMRGRVDEPLGQVEPRVDAGADGEAILRQWVAGAEVDWKSIYPATMDSARRPRRISLPPSPFARNRYWIDRPSEPSMPEPEPPAAVVETAKPAPSPEGMALSLETADAEPEFQAPPLERRQVALSPLPVHAPSFSVRAADPVLAARNPLPVSTPASETVAPPSAAPVAVSTQVDPAASGEFENKLRVSLAETLFMEPGEIGSDKPFVDLGLDSIVAVEWIKRIDQEFSLEVTASIVYDHPTLRRLSTFLYGEMRSQGGEAHPAPEPPGNPPQEAVSTDGLHASAPDESISAPAEISPSPSPSQTRSTASAEAAPGTASIAVIGIAGRFPGGPDLDAFWSMLDEGKTAFTALPKNRGWDLSGIYAPSPRPNSSYVRRGAFLDQIDCFDPLFFQISPKEAMTMDPCERLFLEESWRAIEDAGIDPRSLSGGRWGVFCGNGGDYSLHLKDVLGYSPHVTLSQVPARVSHFLNLQGPCHSLDAGCASSLLAIAQACDQLATGQCEAAIAGGALIHSTPNLLVSACQVELLSSGETGTALDAQARGMMPGEGVGVVVLKRLADALADGDRIYGVIEGWGVNHNGRTNGMVTPNADAEAALFSQVYDRFGIDPESVTLVEANASGMPLADAAEIQAMSRILGSRSSRRQLCTLGTVENNIGHAFHAAGIAHLMKVILSLRHRRIPGTPNVQKPQPALDDSSSPFLINASTLQWHVDVEQVRRAAVSSFGATGSNVHLVVSEFPSSEVGADAIANRPGPVLIALSARTPAGLRQRCHDLERWLGSFPNDFGPDLHRLSANLLMRRAHFEERCALVVRDLATLRRQLSRLAEGHKVETGFLGSPESGNPGSTPLATSVIRSLADPLQPDEANLLMLASLYAQGADLEMPACFTTEEKAVLSLPGYPFEKRRCWVTGPARPQLAKAASDPSPAVPEAAPSQPSSSLVDRLALMVCELTGMLPGEIESDKPLRIYGVDSLMGMRLLNRINASTGANFDVSLLSQETLDNMTAAIHAALRGRKVDLRLDSQEACPSWIDQLEIEIHPPAEPLEAAAGEEQLERLLQAGFGVSVTDRVWRFEFLKGTQSLASLQAILSAPGALLPFSEPRARYYPVTPMQRLALEASDVHGSAALNIGQAFWIDTPVNMEALQSAFHDMTQHHSILRTGARRVGNHWAQVVYDTVKLSCQEECWPGIVDRESFLRELETFQKQCISMRYRANGAPMLDLFLLHNEKDLAAVYFQTHHFHADGFTLFLFQQELHQRYRALVDGSGWKTPPAPAEYAHFALDQFDPVCAENTRFWRDRLGSQSGGSALRDLPSFLEEGSAKAGVVALEISSDLSAKLQEGIRGVTLTQMITGAVGILLYRLTGRNLPIQMVYSHRDRMEYETVFGDFSSSAPLLLGIEPEMTLRAVMECYDRAILEIQTHKRFDLMQLMDWLRDPQKWVGISIDSNDRDALGRVTEFADRLIDIPLENRDPVAPLVVCLEKTRGRLTLQLLHDRSCLSSRTMELFSDGLRELLVRMAEEPDSRVEGFRPSSELQQRLALGRDLAGSNSPEFEKSSAPAMGTD